MVNQSFSMHKVDDSDATEAQKELMEEISKHEKRIVTPEVVLGKDNSPSGNNDSGGQGGMPYMSRPELKKVMHQLAKEEEFLREQGQKEYARKDNAFGNFNRIAEFLNLEPEQVLLVYAIKHLDGIVSYANGHKSQREHVRGRINDLRVYLAILAAMIQAREGGSYE